MGIGRNAQELLRKVQAAKYVEEHGDSGVSGQMEAGRGNPDAKSGSVGLL